MRLPVTNATANNCHMVSDPATYAAGIDIKVTPRPMSAATRTGRRRTRSSHAPAGSVNRRNGSISTAARAETWRTPAPSMVRAMNGSASIVIWLPMTDTVAADQILMKSRFRQSAGLAMIDIRPLSRGMLSAKSVSGIRRSDAFRSATIRMAIP